MTFPHDAESDPETIPARSDSESQPGTSTSRLESDIEPITQADLWAPDPSSETASYKFVSGAASAYSIEEMGARLTSHELPLEPAAGGGRSRRRFRHIAWELTQTLVLAVLIFLLVRTVAQNFRVEGPSMEPGLHDGQYLLVNKAAYFKISDLTKFIPFVGSDDSNGSFLFHGPQRGDVVVFRFPGDLERDFIKRIIGVPGDRVRVQDGIVYVNDVPLEEDYITANSGRDLEEEQVVPADNYFVLGDNRPYSSDSRSWGFVPEENIIGKALLSYWPLDDLGGVGNRSLDLGVIKLPLP